MCHAAIKQRSHHLVFAQPLNAKHLFAGVRGVEEAGNIVAAFVADGFDGDLGMATTAEDDEF